MSKKDVDKKRLSDFVRKGGFNQKTFEAMKKVTKGFDNRDERFWEPTIAGGVAAALIRFLPNGNFMEGDDYLELYQHFFKMSSGTWFVETCPTTAGEQCPVCEANKELWNSEEDANQNIARNRARKRSYISNIMVIKDTGDEENNGKFFLFRYGKAVMDKILERTSPTPDDLDDETAQPVNVFNPIEGFDFKIKVKLETITIGKRPISVKNFDNSLFLDKRTDIVKGAGQKEVDLKLDALVDKLYKLEEIIEDGNFRIKSYEELKEKFSAGLIKKDVSTVEDDEENEVVEETEKKKEEDIDEDDIDFDEDEKPKEKKKKEEDFDEDEKPKEKKKKEEDFDEDDIDFDEDDESDKKKEEKEDDEEAFDFDAGGDSPTEKKKKEEDFDEDDIDFDDI